MQMRLTLLTRIHLLLMQIIAHLKGLMGGRSFEWWVLIRGGAYLMIMFLGWVLTRGGANSKGRLIEALRYEP